MSTPGYTKVLRSTADSRYPSADHIVPLSRRLAEVLPPPARDTAGGRPSRMHLYFLDNFRRNPRNLVAVKQRWDPADIFRSAQSLPAS